LGNDAAKIHFETGQKIAELKIDKLFGVEGFAQDLLNGANLNDSEFYENSQIASEKFLAEVQTGDLILVKGSRGVRTEKVIEKLLENFEFQPKFFLGAL
jgi:UDP-N-acetylmuramoyl-tripeptide--D-alanyl-D-alanine ligase